MTLLYRIFVRLSLVLSLVLAGWGIFFYWTMIDEVNDEVDDSLEDYSEGIILRALAGQELPSHSDGTNNSYYLSEITPEEADRTPSIQYTDEMVYIQEKGETEPARILKTIFKDRHGRYFQLTVSIPTLEKEDLREAILYWIIFLYVVLLVTLLAVSLSVFYRSLKPLYTLLKWLDQYTLGQHDTPPPLKTRIPEFRKLNEAAIRSAERNQAIFEQQKQFIGNASHELQTPLAICQNRLEMLVEGETLSEEQLTEVHKIQQTLSYIIRLNKSLLFLSKIDNGQFQENQEILLNDLIRRQLEDYQEIYAYKQITVDFQEKSLLRVNMNETLATALITNLLKNAYIHNIPQGHISIRTEPYKIVFCNTGASGALDNRQIFNRFYQTHRSGEGTAGLGLSIAQAIAKIYQIEIQYTYQEQHCFEVIFPKTDKK